MRFAVAAALFAGAAMAGRDAPQSTLYTTKYYTITACPSTVTDCPAKTTSTVIPLTTSTVYTTKVYTVTACPDEVEDCPSKQKSTKVVTETEAVSTTVCPIETVTTKYGNGTVPHGDKPHGGKPSWSKPAHTTPAACPTYSVKTISTSVTTVIPTVIYETVSIPCPTPEKPTYGGKNETAKPSKPVTAGAGSVAGSVVFAAIAGVAAFAFA